uniref:Glycoside hydrolase family 42 N-terminal domain-containing protein n=1 Tax=Tetradesmus obliquus TaxID=3088 RepID=A0A383VY54_TETOB|eukprot:jgi/Sobl393_1/7167/SZX69694.1
MINGFGDLEGTVPGSNLPVCQYTLQRARRFTDSVSFALAVHPFAVDKERLESWTFKDAQGNNVVASKDSVARWQRGLQACFDYAIKIKKFRVLHVLGHWDPLHPVLLRPTTWRNLMNIAPQQKAAGHSYEDVMLQPVVKALNAVSSPSVEVWFSVSGEMGLSNYLHADAWRGVMANTRQQLRRKQWKDVKVATALNWQMFCGCIAAANPEPGSFDPLRYNASFAREFAQVKHYALPYVKSFKLLLSANDFIGISGYGSGYRLKQLSWRDMEVPLQTLAYELGFFGINLKEYTSRKPVIYVEQGLGGVLQYGILPAPDLATVSRYTFSGSWPVGGYKREFDPWQRQDFSAYRRGFYRATVDLLARGKGQQYKLDGVYVWSVGSFDVFGVHPVSSSSEGTFADPAIISMIKKVNGVS